MNPLYVVVDDVAIPDWLIEAVFCEPNKGFIETAAIQAFTTTYVLPYLLAHPDVKAGLEVCSNHVHIGSSGLTPHDHLPNAFTSVLYLMDAEGELVIEPCGAAIPVKPKAGRLVFFAGTVVHSVNESPSDELRMSLVSNYEYPSV